MEQENDQTIEQTKKYPGHEEVIEQVLKRFDEEGFGCFFSHDEIRLWADMPLPGMGLPSTFQKYTLSYLDLTDKVKNYLLIEHQLAVQSVIGEGYRITTPREQVTDVSESFYEKARKMIRKSNGYLVHIRKDELSPEELEELNRRQQRNTFVQGAMRKRKVFKISDKINDINRKKKIEQK